MSLKIIHISDLHIGEEESRAKNFHIISRWILQNHGASDEKPIIIITGDVVNDGRKSQFDIAALLMGDLSKAGFVILAAPGNHDYGVGGWHAVEKKFKYFKNIFFPFENVSYPHIFQNLYSSNGHYLIGLNSMKAESGFWEGLLANGQLGPRQIEDTEMFLKKLSGRDKGKKVILYLHHHPFIFPDDIPDDFDLKQISELFYESRIHQLKDGAEFMKNISGQVKKPLVDILLFGHDHCHLDFSNTIISKKYGIPVILSSGKSTKISAEYETDLSGKSTKKKLHSGLLGRQIEIDDGGKVTYFTIDFRK